MDDHYNDLTPTPQNPDACTPPAALSPAEQQAWLQQRIAAVKAWEQLLTPAYFEASQGDRLRELQSQLENLGREASTGPAPHPSVS